MSLIDDLIRDEGKVLHPYKDTVGKVTIGVGRNLDDMGVSESEAMLMLLNDIDRVRKELKKNIPWYTTLPKPAQKGLENMCFNLGWPRLSGFRRMLAALENRHFNAAADESLDSKWARQVGARATRIAQLYRSAGQETKI